MLLWEIIVILALALVAKLFQVSFIALLAFSSFNGDFREFGDVPPPPYIGSDLDPSRLSDSSPLCSPSHLSDSSHLCGPSHSSDSSHLSDSSPLCGQI